MLKVHRLGSLTFKFRSRECPELASSPREDRRTEGGGATTGIRGALRAAQGQRTRHSRAPSLRAAVRRRAAKTGASSSRSALRARAVPGSLRTTTEPFGEPSVATFPYHRLSSGRLRLGGRTPRPAISPVQLGTVCSTER